MIKKIIKVFVFIKELFKIKLSNGVCCQKKSNHENRDIYQYDYCYPTYLYKDSIKQSIYGCINCGKCGDKKRVEK